jgi:malonyl-CoA/methylmalonyl-CoA synthetase
MTNANFFTSLALRAPEESTTLLTTVDGAQYNYGDLERQSAKAANALRELGLQPGDRVSVQIEKSVANLWLYMGVLRAGLVFHPLNTGYALEEMRFFLGDAEPGLLVCDPAKSDAYKAVCEELGIAFLLTLDADGHGSLADVWRNASSECETEPREGDDLAVLLYSSGTTGRPKGIMLSHENLRSNADVLVDYWQIQETDVLLHALPIYHVHGLFVGVHCVLMSGASMHWLPAFEAKQVRSRLPLCTIMMGVPTYYTRLLADPDFGGTDCRTMRLFISGSAPLLEETFNTFAERTGHTILERYGMSETGMNASNPLDGERRAGTVGFPLPGTQIRICDDAHRPLDTGEVGELEVRGPNVFKGYWRMPRKTAEDFTADGWFVTGDQGRIDERGYVSIVGRSKDMVITGGLNVYPKEIEIVINGIEGVVESAVFGVPHPDFGEAVVATVVVRPNSDITSAAIDDVLRAKIAKFKLPKRVQIADQLPRNAMGKVQKNVLRQEWDDPF